MIDQYVLATNDDGDLAIRTVSATESSSVTDTTSVITATDDGKLAVRVVGAGGDSHNKGFFATQQALEEAYPTGEAGDYAIVGATDTVWIWDEDSSAWVDTDTKGQVESVNGKTGTVVLSATDVSAIPQYSTMPTESASVVNKIVQYSGATNASYTNGYFYVCKVSVTPSSATASQTTGSSLSDVAVNKSTFETQISETGNYEFTYDEDTWTYNSERVDLTDYGITYTGTPDTGDVITVAYYAPVYLYYWERINVQPSVDPLPSQTGNSGKFLTTDGTDASWSDKPLVNTATGQEAVTILGTPTSGQRNINIGYGATATAYYNIAMGVNSQATGSLNSIAIGSGAKAQADNAISIGDNLTNTGKGSIQLGSGTNSTAGTFNVGLFSTTGATWHNYRLLDSNGTIPTDRLTHAINKYSSMPTAASTNLGWIVQYTGTTDSTYTHGYIYECVSDGGNPATYSWAQTNVQPTPSGLPSQTGNSGKFLTTDGTDASWSDKPLVNTASGNESITILGTAAASASSMNIGYRSSVTASAAVAIGRNSKAGESSIALGNGAETTSVSYGQNVALGFLAKATKDFAIQLGHGTNSETGTFCVGSYYNNASVNYKLLDADGTIPTDRYTTTPVADGTYVPTLTIASGVATRTWGAAASAPVVPATAPTLAVADWSSNTQTITVSGVTSSNVVLVGPAPSSAQDYADAGILCTAQGTDSLTFTCTTVPSNAITLSVVIFG